MSLYPIQTYSKGWSLVKDEQMGAIIQKLKTLFSHNILIMSMSPNFKFPWSVESGLLSPVSTSNICSCVAHTSQLHLTFQFHNTCFVIFFHLCKKWTSLSFELFTPQVLLSLNNYYWRWEWLFPKIYLENIAYIGYLDKCEKFIFSLSFS